MKRILTFKQKLVLTYIVLIVLPMSVLGMGAYRLYSDAMEKKVSDFVQQVAISTASNIEMYIRELEQFTLMPYYNKEFQDMLTDGQPSDPLQTIEMKEEIEKTFSFWQSQRESVENITYFSKPGAGERRVYSTGYPYDSLKVEEARWDERAFGSSDRIVTHLSLHQLASSGYAQRMEPIQVFSLIRKIYYSSTVMETAGYFQVDFTLEDIGRIMNRINHEENGSFFLLDQDRRVVFASQPLDEGILEHAVGLQEPASPPQIVRLHQQNTILVHHPVGKMDWIVVGYVPVSQIVSGIANVRNSMILIGLVCIVLAIIITITISHRMTIPIYKLIALIKRVETEDFQIQYDNPPRNEIGQLIRSFIRMSGRLDETIRNLYQAEIVRKDSELRTLKSQINPHFLFNTLETIKMKAEIDEADATVDMITALGKLVKASLQPGNDFITLREEQAYLLNYFYTTESLRLAL
ncbi:cache domain-containing sensor histidine kinase [Paenibacillus sp. 1P07SE]|uniref:cache domain-containing sensor histidine kinase n=1 Tax=Paenibacillus sp. 1P07SE TaxID=3132209 RepID=UPI0039A65F28